MYEESNFFKVFEVIVSTMIGILGGLLLQSNSLTSISEWFTAIFIFIIIGSFIFLFQIFITNLLQDKSKLLRKLVSKHYIEGDWIQIIYDDNLKEIPPTKYSRVKIFLENGMIKISGSSYNQYQEGDQMTSFMSKHSTFVENVLTYYYSFDTRESREKSDWFGRCKFTFSIYNNRRCLNKYEGEVHSNIRKEPILVRAIRVNKKMKINIKTDEGRIAIDKLIKSAF